MQLGMSLFHCNYTLRHILFQQLFLYMVRTPAPKYTLHSPISPSQIPPKAPTQHESEAAKALLTLFSSHLKSLVQSSESYNMDVNVRLEVQGPMPNDLSISATPLFPLPISQDIDTGAHVPCIQKEQTSKVNTMLENLCKACISFMDLLLAILGGDFPEFYSHWLTFLCDSEWICEILLSAQASKKTTRVPTPWINKGHIWHIVVH